MRRILIGIAVLAVTLWVGYYVTLNISANFINGCDEKYGVGNWETIEITGTKEAPKFFIGQSWKCVEDA